MRLPQARDDNPLAETSDSVKLERMRVGDEIVEGCLRRLGIGSGDSFGTCEVMCMLVDGLGIGGPLCDQGRQVS